MIIEASYVRNNLFADAELAMPTPRAVEAATGYWQKENGQWIEQQLSDLVADWCEDLMGEWRLEIPDGFDLRCYLNREEYSKLRFKLTINMEESEDEVD